MWQPSKGRCHLIDAIAKGVLDRPVAITDYGPSESDPDGCFRGAAGAEDSIAVALYSHTSSMPVFIADARKQGGAVSEGPASVGKNAKWIQVNDGAAGPTTHLAWTGADGRTWTISYSGPDTPSAVKPRMISAAQTVNRYVDAS